MQLTAPDYVVLIVEELDRALRFTRKSGTAPGPSLRDTRSLTPAPRAWRFIRAAPIGEILAKPLRGAEFQCAGIESGFKVAEVDAALAGWSRAAPPQCRRPMGLKGSEPPSATTHLIELRRTCGR
jgi:hypothetical protein